MAFPSDYMKLFNASSHALKSVDPQFRIGGPATARLDHVKDFVDQCKASRPRVYSVDSECTQYSQYSRSIHCLTCSDLL
jgi:hypothetical protein